MDARRKIVFYAVASVLVVALAAVVFWPRGRDQQQAKSQTPTNQQAQKAPAKVEPGTVMIGGVRRKATDIQPAKPLADAKAKDATAKAPNPFDYGRAKGIPANANPQVAAVAKAIREHKNPERYSVMARPKPFDANAYKADPASYLEVVEPGRVFCPAKPGKGVPRLTPIGYTFQKVAQGSTVKLKAAAPAGAPVTFTSFDMGEFQEGGGLCSATVKANNEGVAEATFLATPGVVEDVNILAASPMASGQVKYVVNVQWPDDKSAAK